MLKFTFSWMEHELLRGHPKSIIFLIQNLYSFPHNHLAHLLLLGPKPWEEKYLEARGKVVPPLFYGKELWDNTKKVPQNVPLDKENQYQKRQKQLSKSTKLDFQPCCCVRGSWSSFLLLDSLQKSVVGQGVHACNPSSWSRRAAERWRASYKESMSEKLFKGGVETKSLFKILQDRISANIPRAVYPLLPFCQRWNDIQN